LSRACFDLQQLIGPGAEKLGDNSCLAFGITFPSIQLVCV
jgi:hypothetical protein